MTDIHPSALVDPAAKIGEGCQIGPFSVIGPDVTLAAGVVVKSHGGANYKGVANAIHVAASMVRNDITRKIADDLDNFRAHAFSGEAAE